MGLASVEGLLTDPYVSVAEFRAAPTWLDSDDLIPGGASSQQDDELKNVLLRASAWADNHCNLRLGAHVVTEQMRGRVNRFGQLMLHPSNFPVRSVTNLAYGADFQRLTTISNTAQYWVENEQGIVIALFPNSGQFMGSLQFGSVAPDGGEVFVQIQYIAGYASTTLTANVTPSSSTMPVADATGFLAPSTALVGTLRGSVARVWDPGQEEAVSVNTGYTAVTGPATVPLAASFQNSHAQGVLVSEMPAEIHQAVICYAVGLLMREDVTAEEPFAHTPYGPTARKAGRNSSKAGGLVNEAECLLNPYRRRR